MTYDEMTQALVTAERTMGATDAIAERIVRLLVGRLRKVNSTSALRQLKAELTHFDSRVGRWRA